MGLEREGRLEFAVYLEGQGMRGSVALVVITQDRLKGHIVGTYRGF